MNLISRILIFEGAYIEVIISIFVSGVGVQPNKFFDTSF